MDDRIFYGPHPCVICGDTICRASQQQGGESFDYPVGPIYPNTPWRRHVCGSLSSGIMPVRAILLQIPRDDRNSTGRTA